VTLAERIQALTALLPASATVTLPVAQLREWLADDAPAGGAASLNVTATWRERLWTCPPETHLGVRDVAEAVGRPRSWVYRAVSGKREAHRLPARRLDGELVFTAGDVRTWLARQEEGS
jgi:predicted DNA-binding transcriptional regulator AlpA